MYRALVLLLIVLAGPAAASEIRLQLVRVTPPEPVRNIQVAEGWLAVTTGAAMYRLEIDDRKARLVRMRPPPPRLAQSPPEDRLPDTEITSGSQIAAAWLIYPTTRYQHAVLGDDTEAGGLAVRLASGREFEFVLPEDSVFEDRRVQIADVNGDGREELLVVRSYLDRGSALAVLEVTDRGIRILAETPPTGRPQRWLNPIGAADFDGDGRKEIALVRNPHTEGRLQLWELGPDGFRMKFERAGFSNHAPGSRALDLAGIADFDDDGIADLAVPSLDRQRIMLFSLRRGIYRLITSIASPAAIITALHVGDFDHDGSPDLAFGSADGTVTIAFLRPV